MIEEALLKSNYIGKDGFSWWIGQIAHPDYWKKAADYFNGDWNYRCKVRIIGYHPFSGSVLSDEDLPWAQVMIDPAFGSAQGGTGKTLDLKGGETCFGFFLDGDDAQQPVVLGLLHRSDGVKNLISEQNVKADMSSGFKPFTGHPGGKVRATQREVRKNKEVDQANPTASTTQETSPIPISFADAANLDLGLDASGVPKNSVSWDSAKGFTTNINAFDPKLNLFGDKLVCQAQSTYGIEKKCDKTYIGVNGCENNLIGQITQVLQDFIAVTNGLDQYLHAFIDPVLNEIVDIGNSIKNCARQIGGIVKLIINNLRNTIFKCITWAFRKLVAIKVPLSQQKIILEAMKKYLDIIFCILEKLPAGIIDFIQGLLGDLASNNINSPVCAVEQWTAGILAKVMDSIENALSVIMSGIGWLTGGLSTVSGILNTASSLASQIFSFLECTGLACKTPSVWASKFGPSEKEADDWEKMVGSVNVFKGVSDGLGSIEAALGETPLYAGITGVFNDAFSQCNQKVQNPTSQYDIVPLPVGSKYSTCIPPIVNIFGDGVGASAIPIVDSTGSIFSVEILSSGVGYTIPPTISIVDNSGCGSGAEAQSIINQDTGSIEDIYITNAGSGYAQGNYTNIGTGTGGTGGTGTGGTGGTGTGGTGTGGTGTGGTGTGTGTGGTGGTGTNVANSGDVSGCVKNIIVTAPGYGYTTGDTITDGKNTYTPIVTPGSGAIIGIQPLTNPICGFDRTPTLTINTRTGVAADVIPIMRFTPTYTTINQDQVNQAAITGIVTSVVDCV
jgi:hypothetical protein